MVLTGLEVLIRDPAILKGSGRLGLLYNQASIDSGFRPAPGLLAEAFPGTLLALFGPQHGVWGTEQDNMIETDDDVHPDLGLPIHSLYSHTRRPTPEMLEGLDTVLVDIQDVGTRVYTFATTVVYLMESAATAGVPVVILDRPNPINGIDIEGKILEAGYASFVGPYPIPMRHGLTLGELIGLYNEVYSLGCRLKVIPAAGWDRESYFDETGLPWVMPSPNMPLVETAVVYPGQVMLEGTNLSEGRGTTRPFEMCGGPFLEPTRLLNVMDESALKGAVLRQVDFRPTFGKWAGQICKGVQLHVVNRKVFRPYRLTLALLSAVLKLYPDQLRWSDPPYEYVYDQLPIDVILGDRRIRVDLEAGRSVSDLEQEWQPQLDEFARLRSRFLLYPV